MRPPSAFTHTTTMQPAAIALPTYRCHKRVQAVKIKDVQLHDPTGSDPPVEFAGGFIIHDLPDLGPIPFDADFWNKHKPRAGDYLVIYKDGYRSISPGKAFEDGYTLEGPGLNFGQAIEALKKGCRVARKGWNGKGMYLWLLPAATVKAEWCREQHLKAVAEANGGEIEALGSIRMMTADKKLLTGWLASQTDMLCEDWEILA